MVYVVKFLFQKPDSNWSFVILDGKISHNEKFLINELFQNSPSQKLQKYIKFVENWQY